eukprot:scaffold119982_cov63-Phaeocystis_antarctica.AAC.2
MTTRRSQFMLKFDMSSPDVRLVQIHGFQEHLRCINGPPIDRTAFAMIHGSRAACRSLWQNPPSTRTTQPKSTSIASPPAATPPPPENSEGEGGGHICSALDPSVEATTHQ